MPRTQNPAHDYNTVLVLVVNMVIISQALVLWNPAVDEKYFWLAWKVNSKNH